MNENTQIKLFEEKEDKNYEPHSLEEYRIEYENKSKSTRSLANDSIPRK